MRAYTIPQSVFYNSSIALYTTTLTVTTPGLLLYIVTVAVVYSCNKSLPKQLPTVCCVTIPDSMMIAFNDQAHTSN